MNTEERGVDILVFYIFIAMRAKITSPFIKKTVLVL